MERCPCGSGQDLEACCGPLLAGTPAPTAEALMRSRYVAYTRGDIDHLVRTMSVEARVDFDPIEARSIATDARWDGLEVHAVAGGGPDDDAGEVEYVARFRYKGQNRFHHERARFERDAQGAWQVAGGEANPRSAPRRVVKVGRNDPCPCGSGKKYKKCCGA
ncbi:YchJ family protein [Roseospira visakhapatnamensis]|nr:YchJ family metal-binding protein [Roseospira visakhapatnamensis]